MKPLTWMPVWTTDAPTEPGWYWLRVRGSLDRVVEVNASPWRLYVTGLPGGYGCYVGEGQLAGAQWSSGPVFKPLEPEQLTAEPTPVPVVAGGCP